MIATLPAKDLGARLASVAEEFPVGSTVWHRGCGRRGCVVEYASFGLFTKLNPVTYKLSPFDRNKSFPYVATEALYDLVASPIAPPRVRDLAVTLVDPVQRRSDKLASWNYNPGMVEAIMANTPWLSKSLPPAGQPKTAALGPFDPKEWLTGQRYSITSDKKLTPEQKRAALQHLAEEYQTIVKLPFEKQHEILKSFGFNMDAWDPKKTTTINFAPDLVKLREMGLDKEAVHAVERKSTNKRTGPTTLRPGISYIPPQNLSMKSRRDELLREITGLNVKRTATGAVRKAMSKEEFFAPAK